MVIGKLNNFPNTNNRYLFSDDLRASIDSRYDQPAHKDADQSNKDLAHNEGTRKGKDSKVVKGMRENQEKPHPESISETFPYPCSLHTPS